MERKRNVILFGAGAVISWGGPKTIDLTELLRTSGFYIRNKKIRITEYIYTKLITSGYEQDDVNFETIISIIEELIVYYAHHGSRKKKPALIKPFFNSLFEQELMNFEVYEKNSSGLYKLRIPGVDDNFSLMNHGNETPEQFFLQQLLAYLLTEISIKIEKYAYHTKSNSSVISEENSANNSLFQKWIWRTVGRNILRMYTLNYDRIFKIILSKSTPKYEIFEGFNCEDTIEYSDKIKADVKRILLDQECNTHYNLHGSIFWRVDALNKYQLELPEFHLTSGAHLEVNTHQYPTFQSEKGKTVFLTNFITGYQKTQRAIFSPFKQMQAAFDRDCVFCDRLYIIGYSFSDEHINSSIRTALQANPNLTIEIVDPGFKHNDFDLKVMLNIFSASDKLDSGFPKNLEKNVHSFLEDTVIVHAKTFNQYMIDAITPQHINRY